MLLSPRECPPVSTNVDMSSSAEAVKEVAEQKTSPGRDKSNRSSSNRLLNLVQPPLRLYGAATPSEDGVASPLVSETTSRSDISTSLSSSYQYQYNVTAKQLCKKLFLNRVPKGKAAFVVFIINLLESCVFLSALKIISRTLFGATDESTPTDMPTAADVLTAADVSTAAAASTTALDLLIFNVFLYTAGRVFYPVAGLVADVYLGRNRVIQIGMWLFWMGFAVIIITLSNQLKWDVSSYLFKLLPILGTVLIMLGSACIESTIIPFGVDQIEQGAPSEELSSYFFFYFLGRQFGYILSMCLSMVISYFYSLVRKDSQKDNDDEKKVIDQTIRDCFECAIMLTLVTVSIVLHSSANSWFFKARQRKNPLKIIFGVLFFAATVRRHAPRYRRSFRYGEGRLPRIELAKIEYDGKFSSEDVEDVKTFVRVLFIICCLGFTFTTYGAVSDDCAIK